MVGIGIRIGIGPVSLTVWVYVCAVVYVQYSTYIGKVPVLYTRSVG